MSIETLMKIMPPPDNPIDNNSDWISVEKQSGYRFPDNYKQFINFYGTGGIGDFLWILNPFSENEFINFNRINDILDAYESVDPMYLEISKRPRYPEEDSFLPWAITDNGDSVIWVVNGPRENWTVGIQSADLLVEETFEMNMVQFLESLITFNLDTKVFPGEFLEDVGTFNAYTS